MEKNYTNKDYFNYENYLMLIAKINDAVKAGDEDADDDLDVVTYAFDSFFDYVKNVDMSESRIKSAYIRYENKELVDTIMAIDRSRRIFHEAAIAQTNLINRVAKLYSVDKIFTGNIEDRLQVADFCLDVTVKVFQNRKI